MLVSATSLISFLFLIGMQTLAYANNLAIPVIQVDDLCSARVPDSPFKSQIINRCIDLVQMNYDDIKTAWDFYPGKIKEDCLNEVHTQEGAYYYVTLNQCVKYHLFQYNAKHHIINDANNKFIPN